MKVLSVNEAKQVSGGIVPILAVAYSIYGGLAVRSLAGWAINRGFTTYAAYQTAKYYRVKSR